MAGPLLRMEVSDGRTSTTDLVTIQSTLREIGAGIWPLDFTNLPTAIRKSLRQKSLDEHQRQELLKFFLLPRDRMLRILKQLDRKPHVKGGGELSTFVTSHGYDYPQLYVMEGSEDFTRFDDLHVNHADDGTPVDEFIQMLWGSGLLIHHRSENGIDYVLRVQCPEGGGWLATHDGDLPHSCNFNKAIEGSKCLVQVIGPPRWSIQYVNNGAEEANHA